MNPPYITAFLLGPVALDPPALPLRVGGVRTRAGFPSPAEDFDTEPEVSSVVAMARKLTRRSGRARD